MDTEIPEEGADGASGASCARPDSADRDGARNRDCVGEVASDHIHVLVAYRPQVDVSLIVQWLKGISSRILLQEFAHLRKAFWGRHLWARGHLAVSTGNLTDEMVREYIEQQEGEPVHDDSRFVIDNPTKLPPSRR